MKISVVIPTLNRPVDLKKAVVSVLNQQYPVSQIIVVDQSDENESESVLRELCAASPNLELVYLHEKNIVHRDLVSFAVVFLPRKFLLFFFLRSLKTCFSQKSQTSTQSRLLTLDWQSSQKN